MRGAILATLLVLLYSAVSSALARSPIYRDVRRQTTSNTSLLVDFQVEKPVSVDATGKCKVEKILMEHVFAYSYGTPFVSNYTPPACDFNSVVFNFTVTSSGRQYDRLAIMYLGDIEVWRSSTAEPTTTGIIWTYTKDMSQYLSLWKQPQTIIFDLDNIVTDVYTGTFNTTLTATFFYQEDAPTKADLIFPISSGRGSEGESSVFSLPSENATVQQTLPLDSVRAMVSISANGQIDEEFWYTNVLESDIHTFESVAGTLLGYGPFRELQLFIDGMLAGVVWPFPIIFTGGIAPGFWRPIVGIDAFDLRESEIDITPFLPYLLDGNAHTYTIKVVGVDDNGGNGPATISESSVGSYWLVTGKIFIFKGDTQYNGTNSLPNITAPTPDIYTNHDIVEASNGTNISLAYSVHANRSLYISSDYGTWSQALSYSNTGYVTEGGLTQTNTQSTDGSSCSVNTLDVSYNNTVAFSYPITVNTTYGVYDSGITIAAGLDRGLEITASGRPDISVYTLVSGPSYMDTTQYGTGYYSSVTNHTYSFGDTTQNFKETSYGSVYERNVRAVNATVVSDSAGESGPSSAWSLSDVIGANAVRPSGSGEVREFIGRGPGEMVAGVA
ncbi:putative peptide-n4-(n-acetyl-beta-d-glucosaminyl) asparaginase amidase n [Phaeomoniella chlamydospora]|uniref:Putative peptide-n4-(N-acetyl-beta-d-glucosaminyl) asparaginase amidase n n=1 Tax=Phaeomoniella chlamydospora TaxID=158046 RepID=A0A0G2H123_PHACM|nr:putative peptide-n4-(n-acetyl-beta-d-glucosaminyl) asparaginase amidase n [Phaeomoniella chlamydospora]